MAAKYFHHHTRVVGMYGEYAGNKITAYITLDLTLKCGEQ